MRHLPGEATLISYFQISSQTVPFHLPDPSIQTGHLMWNLQCLPITYRMGCKSLTLSQCSWESGPSPNFQAHEWALLCNISSMKNVTTYLLPSPRGVQKAFSNVEQNVPPPFSAISGNDNFILPVAEAKVLQSYLTPIFSHPHSQPISKSFKIYWEADHFATPTYHFSSLPWITGWPPNCCSISREQLE